MTNIYKNYDVRLLRIGNMSSRAEAIAAATQNLFTISGGNILLTELVGQVTKVFDVAATTMKIHYTPTEASATALDLCAASAAQNAAPVGRLYHLPTLVATGLAVDDAALGGFAQLITPMILLPGVLNVVIATGQNAVTGGKVKWDMTWIPLDNTAQVTVN